MKEVNKNKLTISRTPIRTKQMLHLLQRTPKQYIYSRKGKGGKTFDYVPGGYIKKALNYTFGWLWDFEIKDHGREENHLWVLGKLTIKNEDLKPMIIKEQFGRAEVKFLKGTKEMIDFGSDLKSASTDALKKCASELGFASDVYNREEYRGISKSIFKDLPKPEFKKTKPQNAPESINDKKITNELTQNQKKKTNNILKESSGDLSPQDIEKLLI